MEIIINRQSVCLGDDVDDHMKTIVLEEDATYEDLFKEVVNQKYFPSVYGNNVVWVLTSDSHFCIFSYFTRTNKMFAGLVEKGISEICKKDNRLMFQYYSSPLKWKDKIQKLYNGDTYSLWRDGWLDEYKYCDYVMELGYEK